MNKNIIHKAKLPIAVYKEAHAQYPKAVADQELYCAAFFGHSHPHTKITIESVWRGLLRKCLNEYTQRRRRLC